MSNYIGYTVDGTICLKIVTWSMPHLYHMFLVKSNCVISKENSGIISLLFPTVAIKDELGIRLEIRNEVLALDITSFSDEVYDKPPWDFYTDSTAVLDDEKYYFFTM